MDHLSPFSGGQIQKICQALNCSDFNPNGRQRIECEISLDDSHCSNGIIVPPNTTITIRVNDHTLKVSFIICFGTLKLRSAQQLCCPVYVHDSTSAKHVNLLKNVKTIHEVALDVFRRSIDERCVGIEQIMLDEMNAFMRKFVESRENFVMLEEEIACLKFQYKQALTKNSTDIGASRFIGLLREATHDLSSKQMDLVMKQQHILLSVGSIRDFVHNRHLSGAIEEKEKDSFFERLAAFDEVFTS